MRTALGVLLALLIAAPAHAASTKVSWPEQREYAPGQQIKVTVKGDRKVRVAVVRLGQKGKPVQAMTRRTLKRGTVTATLDRLGSYVVRVGGRERTYKVVMPPYCPGQPDTRMPVGVRLETDRVQRGQRLNYAITNPSEDCSVLTGVSYQVEHQQPDGSWAPNPWGLLIFTLQAFAVPPGGEFTKAVFVPADAPLGTYRLIEAGGFTEPTFEVVA